ncbi:hypothetical protein JCM33374_g1333 [Metschnikowia sp. JCM 33374]|nr:hypothetical protein JCM33374_g1333 [Metschnikowia sp. JCM 33374]
MKSFFNHSKKEQPSSEPPNHTLPGNAPPIDAPIDAPPSYEQSEGLQYNTQGNQTPEEVPQYSGKYGPNEYPPEKKTEHLDNNYAPQQPQNGWQNINTNPINYNNDSKGNAQPPPGTYTLPPQKVNIAYETDGRNTRPGYADYVRRDNERVAQGDFPKPREAFGRGGAPLAPSRKGQGSSGGFPGASGPTYYSSSQK